jgi:hypothetical protein
MKMTGNFDDCSKAGLYRKRPFCGNSRKFLALVSLVLVSIVLFSCLYPTGILPHSDTIVIDEILPGAYIKTWEELEDEITNGWNSVVSLNGQTWDREITLGGSFFGRVLVNGTVQSVRIEEGQITLTGVVVSKNLNVDDGYGFLADGCYLQNVYVAPSTNGTTFTRSTLDSLFDRGTGTDWSSSICRIIDSIN